MTKKLFTGVKPERCIDNRWHEVPTHQAQAWAAYCKSKLVGRYTTRARACAHLDAAVQHSKRGGHGYSLGKRMTQRLGVFSRG